MIRFLYAIPLLGWFWFYVFMLSGGLSFGDKSPIIQTSLITGIILWLIPAFTLFMKKVVKIDD